MNTIRNLRACRHYATLLCAARIIEQNGTFGIAHSVRVPAQRIYDAADPAIWPALDTIKRVMEIDDTVDQPGTVLMHAGIAMNQQADEQGEPR